MHIGLTLNPCSSSSSGPDCSFYCLGLSDEAGAAAPLAMAVKQLGAPVASQVAQLEAYVHETLFTPEGGRRDEYLQVRGCKVLHYELYLSYTCPPSGMARPSPAKWRS